MKHGFLPCLEILCSIMSTAPHSQIHVHAYLSTTPPFSQYHSREGHRSFYPRTPAHSWTWKLCPLAHIPPGRGTGVFIHGPLHIPRHGNSVRWPISLQGGPQEFLSMDPCTFSDMETPSVGPYPSREGHQSFYPWIPAHFQTWKLR